MSGLLALLTALMPILGPLLQSLINKPKKDAAQWARDGAKAHLAGENKNPVAAFYLGSLACAIDGWSEAEWQAQKTAIPKAFGAFQAYAAANPQNEDRGGAA